MDEKKLFQKAQEAALKAYAPYSRFRVGAALLLEGGTIIQGANVENRSYGLSNCAERTALFTAISSGQKDFQALAIATPDAKDVVTPCGACRQVISEFCPPDMLVFFLGKGGSLLSLTVADLLPWDSMKDLKG